jgi:hypothetical protein
MSELRWNVQQGTRVRGPMNTAELHAMARRVRISSTDLVWHDGMREPVEACLLPALGEFFGHAAPVEVRPDYGVAKSAAVAAPVAVEAAMESTTAMDAAPLPPDATPGMPASATDRWLRPKREPVAAIGLDYRNPAALGDGMVSGGTLTALRGTRPWVRFIGVLMMILAGLNLLFVFIGLLGSSGNIFASLGAAVLMLIPTALWLFPAVQLNRYATRISQLQRSQSPDDLTAALQSQESFWRYIGISAIIVLSIYGVIFGLAAVALVSFYL